MWVLPFLQYNTKTNPYHFDGWNFHQQYKPKAGKDQRKRHGTTKHQSKNRQWTWSYGLRCFIYTDIYLVIDLEISYISYEQDLSLFNVVNIPSTPLSPKKNAVIVIEIAT